MGEVILLVNPEPEVAQMQTNERYAHSLSLIRKVGQVAVGRSVEADAGVHEAMLRADVVTCLAEMLNTDKEFRDRLDINPVDTHAVRDGQVVTRDGTPFVELVRGGLESSMQAAQEDPRMWTQVVRDEGDVLNAEAVDRLRPGQMRLALSMDPKEAMRRDGEEFWADSLGYRDGLAFLQWYYKKDDRTLVAGSLSVDKSNLARWNEIWARYGMTVPEDVDCNQRIRYALMLEAGTVQDAQQLVEGVRKQYYGLIGDSQHRLSITEFVAANADLVDRVMRELYIPMTTSLETGHKHPAVADYVAQVLQGSQNLAPEIRQRLMRIHNVRSFDDEAARTVDFVIRYGVVEELRRRLKTRLMGRGAEALVQPTEYSGYGYPSRGFDPRQSLAQNLAAGVAAGAAAGRSYGGCAAAIKMSSIKNSESDQNELLRNLNDSSPQEAYGGRDKKEDWHGGKIKRGESCRVCKLDKIDVGGCDICEKCTKDKVMMGLVYRQEELARISAKANLVKLLIDNLDAKREETVEETPAQSQSAAPIIPQAA